MSKQAKLSLHIVHCFRSPVGGIFRHVRDLVEAQSANGHKVGIVCDSSTGGEYEDKLFESIKPNLSLGLYRIEMQRQVGIGDAISAWRTYQTLRLMKPDILHGHGAKGGAFSRLFGTLLHGPLGKTARLYSAHGGSLHYDKNTMAGKIFFSAERLLERITDRLMFVADYERRTYESKIGTIKSPFEIVYNGVQPLEFEPIVNKADAADFLYIGMMRDLKGPDIFLDALAGAELKTGHKLTAAMVGAGDDLPNYKVQAKRLGLGERVRFFDPMPARQAFALARTVVVPSRAEAMPYIVLETLAAGKPIIATNVGGIPEIFGSDNSAVAEPNVQSIETLMLKALGDEAGWAKLMPAQETLKARFGADVMAADIENAYFTAHSRRNA